MCYNHYQYCAYNDIFLLDTVCLVYTTGTENVDEATDSVANLVKRSVETHAKWWALVWTELLVHADPSIN